jgi:hypothetical protein
VRAESARKRKKALKKAEKHRRESQVSFFLSRLPGTVVECLNVGRACGFLL